VSSLPVWLISICSTKIKQLAQIGNHKLGFDSMAHMGIKKNGLKHLFVDRQNN